MTNKFNIGDVVKWTSKAGGHPLEKSGSIIEIVQVGDSPHANLGHHAGGSPRPHESYIVAVPQKSKSKSPRPMKAKLYWPHVGVLTKIGTDAQFAEAAQQMASDVSPALS